MTMFSKKRANVDADAAWKQQNREQQDNPLYRYINLDKGGKFVDTYVEYGREACEHLIATEIEPFLYNEGKGKVVGKIDYLRWRNKLEAKMSGTSLVDTRPDEQVLAEFCASYGTASLSGISSGSNDNISEYMAEHEACWDLDLRGGVGETALHVCVLHDTPMHSDIAKILLRRYPKMALDIYEGVEYYGETALHLAIVYGDFEMVKLLVESGADVCQRATGRFFLPEDQKKGRTKVTNYEGYAYYGEYPLAFAACFGHEEIYDYLIEHGADPNMPDTYGNTVLHMLVISNQIGMYGYAVKHHAKRAIMETENYQFLTALTLSSKLGRNEIFKEIIELQSIEIWRFSNVTCSTYPLAPLDTIGVGGKTNWSSALIYITDGETDEHLEMLEGGVVKQLLDEKWNTFARRRFLERLVVALLHLLCLSTAIYTRNDGELLGGTEPNDIVRYVAEAIVSLNCLFNLVMQLEEIRTQGLLGFIKNQVSAPAKFIFHISCVLILLCVPCRFTGQEEAEIIFLALAAPCAWANLLFFARGVLLWGPFVIMIYKMCATDILKFVIIYIVFVAQFSLAFYFLFKDPTSTSVTSFQTPINTILQLFQMTLGEFRYEDFDKTRIPHLTKTVFAVFAMLVPILLLNMLIAMMGNTYQCIISRSEKEWKRQWAKIIIVLERTFSRKDLLRFQEEYAVKLMIPGSSREEPGLMVIKTSLKTKARQRKGAIANWKKLVGEVKSLIKEVKKEGRNPEQIDLASQEVAQKLQKRRSNLHGGGGGDSGGMSAEGLLSAMNQLAWEKDLDLEAPGKIASVPEEMESEVKASNTKPAKSSFLSKKNSGVVSPSEKQKPLNNNANNRNAMDPMFVNSSNKPTNPQLLEMQMQDKHMQSYGSPGLFRSSRVSPEITTEKPPIGKDKSKKSSNTKKSLNLSTAISSRPPSARSSSGGSKDSKDSGVSEGRRIANLAMSGSKSSLNSANSLTSLLHQSLDQKPNKEFDDITDF